MYDLDDDVRCQNERMLKMQQEQLGEPSTEGAAAARGNIADMDLGDQWQMLSDKVTEELRGRHARLERINKRTEKRKRQELWANMLRRSSKSPTGQGVAGEKELSNDR